jgi:hypothetical protein
LTKFLLVAMYIFLLNCDTLRTIKELLWQATRRYPKGSVVAGRSENNLLQNLLKRISPPWLSPPKSCGGSFLSRLVRTARSCLFRASQSLWNNIMRHLEF